MFQNVRILMYGGGGWLRFWWLVEREMDRTEEEDKEMNVHNILASDTTCLKRTRPKSNTPIPAKTSTIT